MEKFFKMNNKKIWVKPHFCVDKAKSYQPQRPSTGKQVSVKLSPAPQSLEYVLQNFQSFSVDRCVRRYFWKQRHQTRKKIVFGEAKCLRMDVPSDTRGEYSISPSIVCNTYPCRGSGGLHGANPR